MTERQSKDYPHITGVYGDGGENEGALAVHVVLDPSPNYPECGRIIVGSPKQTPTIEGYIPDLGGFSCGREAAEKLAHTLLDAAASVTAGRDATPSHLWYRIVTAPRDARILAWDAGPVVAEWSTAEEAWVTCEEGDVCEPTHWRPIPLGPDATPEAPSDKVARYRCTQAVEARRWIDTDENREVFAAWFDTHDTMFETDGHGIRIPVDDIGDFIVAQPDQWVIRVGDNWVVMDDREFQASYAEVRR